MERKYLSAKEAADYLNISLNALYILNHYRVIPFYKPKGGKVYYDVCELDNYITSVKIKNRI